MHDSPCQEKGVRVIDTARRDVVGVFLGGMSWLQMQMVLASLNIL